MSKNWFVIHARSGYEAKVKLAIEEAVAREGLEDLVGEILIPTEQVVELKGGKKKETERKFFPGYMLVKMELTEPSWLLVKNTNNVIGFIGGSSGKPSPITHRGYHYRRIAAFYQARAKARYCCVNGWSGKIASRRYLADDAFAGR